MNGIGSRPKLLLDGAHCAALEGDVNLAVDMCRDVIAEFPDSDESNEALQYLTTRDTVSFTKQNPGREMLAEYRERRDRILQQQIVALATASHTTSETVQVNHIASGGGGTVSRKENESNPLYGVRGWLKFFIVVNMYIVPTLFVLQSVVGWIGIIILAEDHPALILYGLITTGVGGFLIIKWVQIARRLRDIVPGVIQEAKTWLKIALGCVLLSNSLLFLSGLDVEDLRLEAIKGVALGLAAFAIWYSYFNVSKRVKATYPDWN